MEIKIGKLKLKNPVMVASGTFGYAKEFEELVDLKKLGAIVTKTITLKPRDGNPMPRVCETASGMLNAIGLQNEGVENFIDEKLPYLAKIGVPIIVSISGDFVKLAKRLDKEEAVDGIELNISCPNVKGQGTPCENQRFRTGQARDPIRESKISYGAGKGQGLVAQCPESTYDVVKSVRKVTDKTLITKLSPNVTDIVEIAKAACKGGTDAVSLVNTFLAMAIDIETEKPKLGNITGGLSGPAIKPIALRMVWEVAKNINKPVIGMGGIMTSEDAIEFLLAGAKAVQIGTANFVDPSVCEKIIKGIEAWTKKK
ncbi:MAG: dihydroorotate dehydrogenase [Candidatus Gorgyraea atricola]|nr:dihydroorotate dehydrogenase [Candidatus Gorgyraea atricola]